MTPVAGGRVVLVVEDEAVLRMLAVDLVGEAGFAAVEASDAAEAVAILERRADVVLMFSDIDMPGGMDGMQLAALVRRRWPSIEIILTSGKVRPAPDRMPARSAFFSKPYPEREIVAAMQWMAS